MASGGLLRVEQRFASGDAWLQEQISILSSGIGLLSAGESAGALQVVNLVQGYRTTTQFFSRMYRNSAGFSRADVVYQYRELLGSCVQKTIAVLCMRFNRACCHENRRATRMGPYGGFLFLRRLYTEKYCVDSETRIAQIGAGQFALNYFRCDKDSRRGLALMEAIFYGVNEPQKSEIRTKLIGKRHFSQVVRVIQGLKTRFAANGEPGLWPAWLTSFDPRQGESEFILSRFFQLEAIQPSVTMFELGFDVLRYCNAVLDLCTNPGFQTMLREVNTLHKISSEMTCLSARRLRCLDAGDVENSSTSSE